MNSDSQLMMPFLLRVKHVWVHGFLIGLLLGVLGVCSYYFFNLIPSFPPSEKTTDDPPAIAQTEQMPSTKAQTEPILPEVTKVPTQPSLNPDDHLDLQLAQVFNGIKDTTLKKDLTNLLNFYSPSFPDLTKKTKSISRSWKLYDYQKMEFKIHEVKYIAENSIVAWVTWDVTVKDLATQRIKNTSKTYQVSFIKESGQWLITGLKNAYW
jgi:hypothetical protein